MSGNERRDLIIGLISKSEVPIPAKTLAEKCEVSRQVIVQDIALIRAAGYDIIATNRGYILHDDNKISKVFKVNHTTDQLEDELCTVVDLGGTIANVIVNHKIYGRMEADLNISSRRDVRDFVNDIKSGKSNPLMTVTSNYHFHEIVAGSDEIMNEIEDALKEKGFLIEVMTGTNLW